ncbi:MAG: NAD(P)H-hydrate dehydratase [Myxococcales bacterium]|nr:NAD(P)H-hydrate dehydratase [Myxococcales bacterium]
MIPVLSRDQMRAFDRYAIETCHVPGVVLMENAGRGAADVAGRILGARLPSARVVVVCGAGNNGGDGFVVARHLWSRGAVVQVFLAGAPERVLGDARVNHDAYLDLGGEVTLLVPNELAELEAALGLADLVIDALFGTGLDRPVPPEMAALIDAINRAPGHRLSLDLPSGLHADSGAPLGACIEAHDTVCFGHLKVGLLTPQGARHAGRIHVCDLGVPSTILGRVGHVAEVIERKAVAELFVPREADAHKFSVGAVLVCAGSAGKSGAALLSARGAFRAGAGLVSIATWPEALAAVDARMPEVMAQGLDRASPRALIDLLLPNRRAVVVGPGFGLDAPAREVVEHLLATFEGPMVLDADGLTLFRGQPEKLAAARGPLVLTPHAGEMGRLLGLTSDEVEADRFGAVRKLVAATRATVLLKGARTIVASPEGRVAVNTTGNPVLATAGSGDVLAGMIGAFLCAMAPFDATVAGVHVHGLAGDVLRGRTGDRGIFASEIADEIPRVLEALQRDELTTETRI